VLNASLSSACCITNCQGGQKDEYGYYRAELLSPEVVLYDRFIFIPYRLISSQEIKESGRYNT
jgi:hypothetical protein